MLSARQLSNNLDSLAKQQDTLTSRMTLGFKTHLHYTNVNDSVWKRASLSGAQKLFPDSADMMLYNRAQSIANEMKATLQFSGNEIENKRKDVVYTKIEWHRKFSLSMACLILFFIGAPLGSIIRKGGLGMPLVVAIVFFLIFHLLNMFGEKFVKENILSPGIGMWLAVICLTPVGIFLTYKAMNDSQLFSTEFYAVPLKKLQALFTKARSKT